jgi:excisionase family DNA binding protein
MSDEKPLPRRVPIKQCAIEINCSERTVRRYIAEGRLNAVRIGPRMLRVDRDSLLALMGGAR